MTQYAVMIFERETPGGVADIPPEVLKAHGELPERIRSWAAAIVAGLALEPTATATTIRRASSPTARSSRARRRSPACS